MGWNEIVVDGRGNIYINGGEGIAVLTPDGSLRQVANGIAFPNGMAITPDNSTLIVAESHGKKLTAFDIAGDGSLLTRRVWADLEDGVRGGICIDADDAFPVWGRNSSRSLPEQQLIAQGPSIISQAREVFCGDSRHP